MIVLLFFLFGVPFRGLLLLLFVCLFNVFACTCSCCNMGETGWREKKKCAFFFASSRLIVRSNFNCSRRTSILVFFGKRSNLRNDVGGINEVNQKDAKEKANKKGKGQIMGKPKQRTKNGRVNKKIIDGAHNTPCKRKTWTNDPLNVSPFVAIVPETDVKPLQRNDACNIF